MRYFIDAEFIEAGPRKPIQMISIAIVCEDGREFYAVSSEFNPEDASPWVRENVLAKIPASEMAGALTLDQIRDGIRSFTDPELPEDWDRMGAGARDWFKTVEFWGYYSSYDWVVLCQSFGTMMDLPERFQRYCSDIKQVCDDHGNPPLPPQREDQHHALADARWNKLAFDFLRRRFL